MLDRDAYLKGKQSQIDAWINRLAYLDALCREAGDDVRIKFEVRLKEFSQNLNDLNEMFHEFTGLNEYGREKFRQIIEKNWLELEESYQASIAECEDLIRKRSQS